MANKKIRPTGEYICELDGVLGITPDNQYLTQLGDYLSNLLKNNGVYKPLVIALLDEEGNRFIARPNVLFFKNDSDPITYTATISFVFESSESESKLMVLKYTINADGSIEDAESYVRTISVE